MKNFLGIAVIFLLKIKISHRFSLKVGVFPGSLDQKYCLKFIFECDLFAVSKNAVETFLVFQSYIVYEKNLICSSKTNWVGH